MLNDDLARRAGPSPSSSPQPLAGPDLFAWMALRRAHAGGVVRFEGTYFDSGRRIPCFLPSVFDELVEAGLLRLGDPDPVSPGRRRASLTSEGCARFTALNERNDQWVRRLMY